MSPSPARMSPQATTSYGQVIEYIQDRLYLASYTHPPTDSTPFPYSASSSSSSKSPHKRTKSSAKGRAPVYFSVDDILLYNRFHADFGPLNIAHLYRFAVLLHEILGDPDNSGRAVVFWSRADPRTRANAACILACYMVLIQSWPPHLALAPIAQADPPLMPFRDAGYSQADYGLSVQDVVYGVWKAKEEGLCGLKDFCLEDYERYERVDQGDFNWITPNFVAFASPQHKPVLPIPTHSLEYAAIPKTVAAVESSTVLPEPMKNVLAHFHARNVGLVVRLNSELYSPTYFTALGIEHLDMIFDDGTCPPLPMVKKFIKLSHDTITRQKKQIAVHCKAGLGRTGCLIGAYLIYRYGFSANDLIAYMRFMRPGMVVGPQQHWLHINQGTFRQWWWEDSYKEKIALLMPTTPTKSQLSTCSASPSRRPKAKNCAPATPPQEGRSSSKRAALGEIDYNEASNSGAGAAAAATAGGSDDNLPAPTPGQPRKTSRMGSRSPMRSSFRSHNSAAFDIARDSSALADADAPPVPALAELPEQEVVEVHTHRQVASPEQGCTEEEWALRRLSTRRTSSKSPISAERKASGRVAGGSASVARNGPRAISYTTTTTTTRYTTVDGEVDSDACAGVEGKIVAGAGSDVENWTAEQQRKDSRGSGKSGSGSGTIGVVKVRSPVRRVVTEKGGDKIRKTSGRVGSMGSALARTKS